ncbi:MAG: Nramp family divalent metal transporter [bacterium]
MNIYKLIKKIKFKEPKKEFGILSILKYMGPGFLVTIGFIDPGNWAANISSGSNFGYSLLWVITMSTVLLIILQHNVANLGIATGLCLSESIVKYMPKTLSIPILSSAMVASIATSLAELLGMALALTMLFGIPFKLATILSCVVILLMLFYNSYQKIEKWIVAFVSLIGVSFIYELSLVDINWAVASKSMIIPSIPHGSIVIIMSLLGAVIMPHNLFLHSEVIQSRRWDLESKKTIKRQLKYEFFDTLFAMVIGWAINIAIILLAVALFYNKGLVVQEISEAGALLQPILGKNAFIVFALAFFCSGFASSITSGMSGGIILSGAFMEPYNIKDLHTKLGVIISLVCATFAIMFIGDPFKALIYSQVVLSIQLPITIFSQIYITSSKKVMKGHANSLLNKIILILIGLIVSYFNVRLLLYILN